VKRENPFDGLGVESGAKLARSTASASRALAD
jgi:hypothetical protein